MDADEYDDVDVMGDEYRREELQEFLEEAAWLEAFGEWARHGDIDAEEWEIVEDLDLVPEFDFFWDFNEMTRSLFHSKSGRSSGASYSVSQSIYSSFSTSHTTCPNSVSPALIDETVSHESRSGCMSRSFQSSGKPGA